VIKGIDATTLGCVLPIRSIRTTLMPAGEGNLDMLRTYEKEACHDDGGSPAESGTTSASFYGHALLWQATARRRPTVLMPMPTTPRRSTRGIEEQGLKTSDPPRTAISAQLG